MAGGTPNIKKPKRKSRLTGLQKGLLAIVIVLAVALVAVVAYKNLFVRPDLGGKGDGASGAEQETIDYGDTDYRYEMEGDRKYDDDYDNDALSRMGYQTQEFDDESGELVTAEDDFADDFEADFDDSYEDEEF